MVLTILGVDIMAEVWNTGVGNIPAETVIYIREDGLAMYWELLRRGMPWALCSMAFFCTAALCVVVLGCLLLKKNTGKME